MLLVAILFLALLKEFKSTLVSFVLRLWDRNSAELTQKLRECREKERDLRKLSESISAQQEFARWARNDRALQKTTDQRQQLESTLNQKQTKNGIGVKLTINALLYVVTGIFLITFKSAEVIHLPSEDTFWTPVQRMVSYPCESNLAVSTWIVYASSCCGVATLRNTLTIY
ncbi:uncharacterized protein LOC134854689 [Symsagittifera roscoffensis]|uniref:uncharacterized protein LOC134854689 n=1 Tax=Symsagittifera roscoffensis TaxID=84072 RepID=UPI00307B1C19